MSWKAIIATGMAASMLALVGPASAASPKATCWDAEGWNGAGWYHCGFSRSIGLGWVGGGNGVTAVIGRQRPTSDFGGVDFDAPQPRFVQSPVVQRYVAPQQAPVITRSAPVVQRVETPSSGGTSRSIGRFSPPVF